MRQLQTHEDLERARSLSDQLEVAGIRNEVRSHEGRHTVWIINETDLEAAKKLASGPAQASPDANRAEAEGIRKQRELDARPVRLPGLSQGPGVAGGPAGQVTLVLILLCVGVSLASSMGSVSSPVVRALLVVPISPEGYYLPRMVWAEPWRLLTPMLIHFGLLHLAFNMLWLYRLGSQIENLQGTRRLLALVALTQAPGAWVQLELTGPLFGGMSGVVYGLFGYSWMQSRYTSSGYVVTDQDTLWLMGWFVVCATGLVGYIANAQHALGLVVGLLAGMPAYVAFHRSSARPAFEEGSWADLNIRGFQRFKRLYYDPYVPLWFVALALVVMFVG